MIEDVSGILLIPGKQGRDCPGSGESLLAECCCDECAYYICCMDGHDETECIVCLDQNCPRARDRRDERQTK